METQPGSPTGHGLAEGDKRVPSTQRILSREPSRPEDPHHNPCLPRRSGIMIKESSMSHSSTRRISVGACRCSSTVIRSATGSTPTRCTATVDPRPRSSPTRCWPWSPAPLNVPRANPPDVSQQSTHGNRHKQQPLTTQRTGREAPPPAPLRGEPSARRYARINVRTGRVP